MFESIEVWIGFRIADWNWRFVVFGVVLIVVFEFERCLIVDHFLIGAIFTIGEIIVTFLGV